MKAIVNSFLLLVVITLLAGPVVAGHFLVSVQTEGSVAGLKTVDNSDLTILPNVRDFNGYLSFNPQGWDSGMFRDTIGLSIFGNKKATYHSLYTLYNISQTQSIKVSLQLAGELAGGVDYDRVHLTLAKQNHETTLLSDHKRGATRLRVANSELFYEGERIWVGDELARVIVHVEDELLITPLELVHKSGEIVTPDAIIFTQERVVSPTTRTIVLQPGETATVQATVLADDVAANLDQKIQIPVSVVAQAYEE